MGTGTWLGRRFTVPADRGIRVAGAAGTAAWALLAVLEHRARHPRRAWTITAGSVLAVSLAGPLTAGQGAAAIVALACMHLATGGVLIPVLRRTARH